MKHTIFIILILFICSCSATHNLENRFFEESKQVNMYAFVGKKVKLEEFNPNAASGIKEIDLETGDTITKMRYVMDHAFNAEYEVVQKVFNDLGSDTVKFKAYDHSGMPEFEKYDYVLLYISKDEDGTFYHQKYQFDPLKKKSNGYFGQNGKSIQELFEEKKNSVFKARGIFK